MQTGHAENGHPLVAVVVNDEITQLTLLSGLLAGTGFTVRSFESAESALADLAVEVPPDIIVTDIYMPGMDGWRFCRLLRSPEYEVLNKVPILAVSAAFDGDEVLLLTKELGANAFLSAPVDGKVFLGRVQKLLRGEEHTEFPSVLIVEDKRTATGQLIETFEAHGYRTHGTLTGKEASTAFSAADYDLVILDYHLPDVLGDVLLREFLRERPGTLCIMTTSDPHPDLALEWARQGAAAYLQKPFDPKYLVHLSENIRRQKALQRVPALLEERTRELQRSEEKYSKAFYTSPYAITISDAEDGRFIDVNEAFTSMTGFTREEALADTSVGLKLWVQGEDRLSVLAALRAGRSVAGQEYLFWTKSGKVITGLFSAQVLLLNKGRCVLSSIADLSERKLAENMLRESECRYRRLVENAPDIVYTFSKQHGGIYYSPRVEQVLGYSAEYLCAHPLLWNESIHPEDRARISKIVGDFEAGKFFNTEYRIKDAQGKWRWLQDRSIGREVSHGEVLVEGMATDITERKQAEAREKSLLAKLEQAARMESLGVMAGGVAHDLNNILGPIVVLPDMVMEYIERHGDPADPAYADTQEAMRIMRVSAERATAVVSDLVVMGRRGQFRQVPVDVNLVVEQMMDSKQIKDIHARRPDVHVSKQMSKELLWCLGSGSRLMRILVNLVGNGAEAIGGRGDVVVRTGRCVLPEPFQGYEMVPAGEYVTIEVVDTGCGINETTLARMFEPFFSTKAPSERSGSGLGLSVVRGLVKDHAGFLDVRSVPGEGTTFIVYLPYFAMVNVPAETGNELPKGGHERVLVVDDDEGQLMLSRLSLKKMGYEVAVVSNGAEAVAFFESARRDGQPSPFDLVVADLIMVGMDGLATCQAIHGLYPEQKLMIASGHVPDAYEPQVKALNVEWLVKPYKAAELARAVRARLDKPGDGSKRIG